MPRATLDVTPPEGVWVADVSRAHPDARFRVLAALPGERSGVGLVEITADDLEAVLMAVEAHAGVLALDVLDALDRTALVRFETHQPVILDVLQDAGLPLQPPVDIVDGVASLEVTGPRERLSQLVDELEDLGVPFEIRRVTSELDRGGLLTPRQGELLRAAVEAGYYDTPREITLTDLAERLDVAQSTLSEALHRAEGTVLRRYVEDLPPADGDGLDRRLD